MFDYQEELEQRIRGFHKHLALMHDRAHNEAQGPCFLIFEERRGEDTNTDHLVEVKESVLERVSQAFEGLGYSGSGGLDEAELINLPTEGWKEDNSQNRFIQFSFENKFFCMDMPRQTLFRPEAEQILRDRSGFFYLDERKQFQLYGEDVEGFDPFRKAYAYGDEESAAADTAFIFHQVWKFPIDWTFYVRSALFGGKHRWEKGVPVE
ncbi:hypothetical protein Pan258_29780 [Symmachiella dynata]|nr:hypothetical protein Pan258_29780 [Symmachiella dynata]